jgi:nitrite reductase/ring-hydroxylating ferredoxin subunit
VSFSLQQFNIKPFNTEPVRSSGQTGDLMKVPLAAITDILENRATEVEFFGRSVILTKNGDLYSAFANYCPHASGPLTLEDGQFKCQWHNATFKTLNGQQTDGPRGNASSLIRLPTRVEDGQLMYVWGE